jgi:hypothetical protein
MRTKNPRGGPDAVSILRAADPYSDPRIAGLTMRCADRAVETLVIVVEPMPPRTKPRVTLRERGTERDFAATVVPPFSALLLPPEATTLIASLSSESLFIKVSGEKATIQGAVDLIGLPQALVTLQASCPQS